MLPGNVIKLDRPVQCTRNGCQQIARRGLVGETDSFGSEIHELCEEHLAHTLNEHRNASNAGYCDWCGAKTETLKPCRDHEEGTSGPVYEVCPSCKTKEMQCRDDY